MEQETISRLLCENMKAIFSFSVSRTKDRYEAEALASDILYELYRSAAKLRDDSKFFGYMWRIAENVWADFVKDRYRHRFEELPADVQGEETCCADEMIHKEDIAYLRRELSLLSEQYRTAVVLYYMENLTCAQISKKMSVSMEMVKYYLFRARKTIREGIDMDRMYGEKSYNPHNFEIDFWGTHAGEDSEYRSFQERRLRGNLLLAAYYTPVTLQELSLEVGVALPYLEDEVKLLEKRLYLICRNGKYITNIPIFTLECTEEIAGRTKPLVEEAADRIMQLSDKMFSEAHGSKFKNQNLLRWHTTMLCAHFSMLAQESYISREYGELPQDGPYSLVNGGGGRGFIWGRSFRNEVPTHGIEGIYNLVPSRDGRGHVTAFNFQQIAGSQLFQPNITESVVSTGAGCFELLSDSDKEYLTEFGYAADSRPNFAVYTDSEYNQLPGLLKDGINICQKLFADTCRLSSEIAAQHAPEHIRQTARYVGAFVYQFDSLERVVSTLYEKEWLKPVEKSDKPAMCVIINENCRQKSV